MVQCRASSGEVSGNNRRQCNKPFVDEGVGIVCSAVVAARKPGAASHTQFNEPSDVIFIKFFIELLLSGFDEFFLARV